MVQTVEAAGFFEGTEEDLAQFLFITFNLDFFLATGSTVAGGQSLVGNGVAGISSAGSTAVTGCGAVSRAAMQQEQREGMLLSVAEVEVVSMVVGMIY